MKKVIRNFLILLLLGKLFILPPKNLYWPSESVKQSRRIGAYVGECRIFKVDTLISGYNFPVTKIWVERIHILGRNSIGIVVTTTKKKKDIIVDIIPEDSFFNYDSFAAYRKGWVIKDSLTRGIGHPKSGSETIITLDCHYQKGDTAIFNIFRYGGEDYNLWKDETMEPIFKIYTVCDWERE